MKRLFVLLLVLPLFLYGTARQGKQKKAPANVKKDTASVLRLPSASEHPDSLHFPMPVKKLDTAIDDRMPVVRPPKNTEHK